MPFLPWSKSLTFFVLGLSGWLDLASCGFVLECCQDGPLTSPSLTMIFHLLASKDPVKV